MLQNKLNLDKMKIMKFATNNKHISISVWLTVIKQSKKWLQFHGLQTEYNFKKHTEYIFPKLSSAYFPMRAVTL
jgi:hypothetical protein